MRGRHWLLLGGAVLVAALGIGAFVLPGLFDWNRLRPEIAALAGNALGREVRIDGRVSLVLLPEPVLTAENLTFGVGGEGRMTATGLRLRVAPLALLSGRIEARELVVRGMELRLPWPLPPDALAIRAPDWLGALAARIERGRVVLGAVELSDVNATLTTAARSGTYQVGGTATLGGRPWRFAVSLTQPGGDGAAGVTASLNGIGPLQGVGGAVTGQAAADGSFSGRLSLRAADLAAVMPAPPGPARAEGRVTVAGGLAAADDLAVDLAGMPLRAALAVRVSPQPRLDIALTAGRLDLDPWVTALTGLRDAPAMPFALGIDVSAEAARLRGGTLRGLRAAADIAGGLVELRELRAVLPGEADLRAAGRIGLPAGGQGGRLDLFAALTAPSARTTLGWLSQGNDPLPPGVLTGAAISGHFIAEAGLISAEGLAGSLDDTTIGGSASLRLGARPGVNAALKLGRVAIGPWLPALDGLPAVLRGLDAELKIEAAEVSGAGITAEAVVLDAASEPGRVTLRRIEAAIAGSRIVASGVLLEGTRFSDARVSLTVPGEGLRALPVAWPEWLLRAVPTTLPVWRASLAAEFMGAGTLANGSGKLTLRLGDLAAELSPNLDLATGKWSLGIAARHPGAPRLFESLGIANTLHWLGDGSLGLIAQVQGQGGRITAESLDLTAGALHATGGLSLALTDGGGSVTGKLGFDTLPLPLPYFRAIDPFPALWPAGWQAAVQVSAAQVLLGLSPALSDLRFQFLLDRQRLAADGIAAKLAGGTLTGTLAIDGATTPPAARAALQLAGAHSAGPVFDLPFDLSTARADIAIALAATGHSPGALLATLDGSVTGDLYDGTLTGVALDRLTVPLADSAVRAALAGGATAYGAMTLDIGLARGVANLRKARLTGAAGAMEAGGSIDLAGSTQDLRLTLMPAIDGAPRIGLRLGGTPAAPRRTPELADLIRWRAERAE